MSMSLTQIAQFPGFDPARQMMLASYALPRLLVACLLGGLIGFERELSHKPSGMRTNLLIAMGCAFFTLLSITIAGDANPTKDRIASNIVQGIGFLGAGLILHNRSRISGLTSAASVFVVASIGMACGAGLYAAAMVAAVLVIAALELIGIMERRASLKRYSLVYEARGRDQTLMLKSILDAMDKAGERLSAVDRDGIGDLQRVSFTLSATLKRHELLRGQIQSESAIDSLLTFRDPEED